MSSGRATGGLTSNDFLSSIVGRPSIYEYILCKQVSNAAQRGVTAGNMVAFGSPVSAKMADLVVAAFSKAAAGSFKGARVLFVGAAADNDRVKAVVEPTGAEYVFVEAK